MGNGRKGDASSQGPKVTSQIPGLSLDILDPVEENIGRRLAVSETDSNYVKLAKQGGHKGLLCHEETNMTVKTKSAYKPPDWFCVDSDAPPSPTKSANPRFLVHQEFQKSEKKSIQPLDSPFGGDNMSAWEREADSIATEETSVIEDSASKLNNLTLSPYTKEENKFRKRSLNRDSAPVSMSKLLSFGYLEDRTPSRDATHSVIVASPDCTAPQLELPE